MKRKKPTKKQFQELAKRIKKEYSPIFTLDCVGIEVGRGKVTFLMEQSLTKNNKETNGTE